LETFLDGWLKGDSCREFEVHLAGCEDCRAAVEHWRSVKQTYADWVERNTRSDDDNGRRMAPPVFAISDYVGILKGRTAIRVFNKFRNLKENPYWGNHFWSRGYCVDTVGLDEEMIRKYVKYQEKQEARQEAFNFKK
jgi:putative transposase